MDLQPHPEPGFTVVSTTDNAQSAAYTGAFFPTATAFTIGGGVFTSNVNVTNNRIRLGDIKLRKEIRLNDRRSGVVDRRSVRASVRRMYSAEIRRDPGLVTVAMYDGDDAEEECRRHVAKYESTRHPNIMQLYGLVSTRGLRAMIFHDELIPFSEFFGRFRNSSVLTTYILGYCNTEFDEATDYLSQVFRQPALSYTQLPVWIRPATGEVCLDLVLGRPTVFAYPWWTVNILRLENVSLEDPNAEALIISSLDEDEYHQLCSMPVTAHSSTFTVSTRLPIPRGPAIFRPDFEKRTLSRITQGLHVGGGQKRDIGWFDYGIQGEILPNSWMRYDSRRACDLHSEFWVVPWVRSLKFWLAQANHVFALLETAEPEFEDYVCMHGTVFILRCVPNLRNIEGPEGHLFVCPPEHFQTGEDLFQWPECPAYWSLDPSGAARLSPEKAEILGFPIIHIETRISGYSWDSSVYAGLRRFHAGKEFDPSSQDVAKCLGYPLFELSCEEAAPLAFHNFCRCYLEDPAIFARYYTKFTYDDLSLSQEGSLFPIRPFSARDLCIPCPLLS
ncbi:hypothetical protein MSAN_01525100 [Mycena sanguinolenta]|uniref:Protein kinase domain-containing protein n=1 Tax=Mycena sanguinolenta TaxID=230812 RepID=A0A8H7CWY1_9AGAR|nr:hypothetical protein MSAN_01525100 [Mycena sanguinolenta]